MIGESGFEVAIFSFWRYFIKALAIVICSSSSLFSGSEEELAVLLATNENAKYASQNLIISVGYVRSNARKMKKTAFILWSIIHQHGKNYQEITSKEFFVLALKKLL